MYTHCIHGMYILKLHNMYTECIRDVYAKCILHIYVTLAPLAHSVYAGKAISMCTEFSLITK